MSNQLNTLIYSLMNCNDLGTSLIDERVINSPGEFVNYIKSLKPEIDDYIILRDLMIERAEQVERFGKFMNDKLYWRQAQSIRNIGVYFDGLTKH